jgi:hypothetical protein
VEGSRYAKAGWSGVDIVHGWLTWGAIRARGRGLSIVGQWGLPGVSLSGRDAQARVLKVGCNLLSAEARDPAVPGNEHAAQTQVRFCSWAAYTVCAYIEILKMILNLFVFLRPLRFDICHFTFEKLISLITVLHGLVPPEASCPGNDLPLAGDALACLAVEGESKGVGQYPLGESSSLRLPNAHHSADNGASFLCRPPGGPGVDLASPWFGL